MDKCNIHPKRLEKHIDKSLDKMGRKKPQTFANEIANKLREDPANCYTHKGGGDPAKMRQALSDRKERLEDKGFTKAIIKKASRE